MISLTELLLPAQLFHQMFAELAPGLLNILNKGRVPREWFEAEIKLLCQYTNRSHIYKNNLSINVSKHLILQKQKLIVSLKQFTPPKETLS